MKRKFLTNLSSLKEKTPTHFVVDDLDLVAIRYGEEVSVLYGRCLHRGALMSDGHIEGENIICGLHGWDYRFKTGVSAYNNKEVLHKFSSWVEENKVYIDLSEIEDYLKKHPQPFQRNESPR